MTQTMEPGTCFTIEPGLYIRPDALDRIGTGPEADRLREKLGPVVARYANIGVRIENSYAFTENGLVNLAEGIPRTLEEVEAVIRWCQSDSKPSGARGFRWANVILSAAKLRRHFDTLQLQMESVSGKGSAKTAAQEWYEEHAGDNDDSA